MPGRDASRPLDVGGWILLIVAFAAVVLHAFIRIFRHSYKKVPDKVKRIHLYTRYERSWLWLQMAFILVLLATGMETHGLYSILGYERAVAVHNFVGLAWLITFAFFAFWIFIAGEWKQCVPTTKKLFPVIRYYSYGIFWGESHPVPKRKEAKHNPLQRLTYLGLAAALLPLQMITGFLYWTYNSWNDGSLIFFHWDRSP
jgi:thiosulfate reductase cytochrome b subunit